MEFKSTILIIPGLGNSGEEHWQSYWEKKYGFKRVIQADWETPKCDDWIKTIEEEVSKYEEGNVILIGHSLACSTIGYWSKKYARKIKGALLVAPSDTEADTYPIGTTGFSPMPSEKIPFPTITVTSSDDYYVSIERAKFFANNWGSKYIEIGQKGHINASSGLGEWDFGIELLKELDG